MKKYLNVTILTMFMCGICMGSAFASEEKEEDLASMINKYVSLSGVIEFEAFWAEDFEGGSESNVELATAELGIEIQMGEWATGELLLEWDGDEDQITIADAIVTVGNTDKMPVTLTVAHAAVPFGVYETKMVSDPLTLEIGETGEDHLMVSVEAAGFYGHVYGFNGDTNSGGGDSGIAQFGLTAGYAMENDNFSLDAGVGYISSIIDSDGLSDAMPGALEEDYVGGVAAHVVAGFAGFTVIGEYVTALDDAIEMVEDEQTGAVSRVNHGKPAAFNVEVAYAMEESEITFAVGFQGTMDLGGILPETRYLATVGVGVTDGLSVAFQFASEKDYGVAEGGTGETANSFVAKLAYEF